ncbi:hypothetical protein BDR04DRAFT_1156247 [Suillus decipiens]|nr:hypothetical protein BDR04DRAFT_1156247 [Suillus decipiens]
MTIPPFDSTTHFSTYSQGIVTNPAGKDWIAGDSAVWKAYDTPEADKPIPTSS